MTEIKNDSFVVRSMDILEAEGAYNRSDANETAFLERELVQLRTREFEVKYRSSLARTFLPKASDIASSASVYSYKVNDRTGSALIGGNGADDAPQVEVSTEEVLGKVLPVRASYGYEINEIREAVRVGTPLSARKQSAARDIIERGIDSMLFDGAGVTGVTGVSNAPSVNSIALTLWDQATPVDTIVGDLNNLVNEVAEQSAQEFMVDCILLPLEQFNVINTKFVGVDNTVTILAAFLANHPGLAIKPWHKLSAQAIAFQMTSDVVEAIIPQEFEQIAPQARNMKFIVNCQARCGGVAVYQPLGMVYGTMS